MPYTPPAQQPAAGHSMASPPISRNHSYTNTSAFLSSSVRSPDRPRLARAASSTSYLSLHRRSPSLTTSSKASGSPFPPQSPKDVCESPAVEGEDAKLRLVGYAGSLRQSPPPVTNSTIPPGAVMSPPDSMQTSSDDEGSPTQPRGRQLDNLAELQEAIKNIGQARGSSPDQGPSGADGARDERDTATSTAAQLSAADASARQRFASTPPLSRQARKVSHSRSSTESSIVLDGNGKTSAEESDSELEQFVRPTMVRKKSGELVKPALRPSSRRRPSSMPGTPTYSKAVHFDSHLEHVRHFLRLDKPQAVSAGSSPQEPLDSDSEYPFSGDESYKPRGQPFEWEILLPNFPQDNERRKLQPVWVERVFLSKDNKTLIGTVAVANIAFHKYVVARFTLDYWKTTSEVVAEYSHDVRRTPVLDGYDRFNFNIQLTDQANLEKKTLFFCVKYSVNGQDFWDNNSSLNYQVVFKKKPKNQKSGSKNGGQSLGARPVNSIRRGRQPASSNGRPWSMPAYFDDFGDGFDSYDFGSYRLSAAKIIGESSDRSDFKGNLSSDDESREVPTRRAGSGGAAFGNRYDFGASLSAAIKSANARSNMTANDKSFVMHTGHRLASPPLSPMDNKTHTESTSEAYPGEKTSTQSPSYLELIDKYCFVRSGAPLIAERS